MKSILIQQHTDKFLQNCSTLLFDNIAIIEIMVANNLYQTFFRHKPEYCIFSADIINQEIIQFYLDYHNDTNIFFFCRNTEAHNQLHNIFGPDVKIQSIGYDNINNIIVPSNLINDQLFIYNKLHNNNGIVCFMDELTSIPNDLLSLLYPNTTIPIKMFNCPQIKHYQNLGLLTQKDRSFLLQNHKYYLDLKQPIYLNYTNEALVCGAIPISIEELKEESYLLKDYPSNNITYITYYSFLKEVFKL